MLKRNDREELLKRNNSLFKDHQNGLSTIDLAKKYNISRERVREIVAQIKRDRIFRETEEDASKLLDTLYELPLSYPISTRLYHSLRRCGINSLKDLKQYDPKELMKKRGIGRKMMKVMAENGLINIL